MMLKAKFVMGALVYVEYSFDENGVVIEKIESNEHIEESDVIDVVQEYSTLEEASRYLKRFENKLELFRNQYNFETVH